MTLKDAIDFKRALHQLAQEVGFNGGAAGNKLHYAIHRNIEKINSFTKDIDKEIRERYEDILLDHAIVDDETKALKYAANGKDYLYTKEGMKKRNKAVEALNTEYECKDLGEFTYYTCTDDRLIDKLITDGKVTIDSMEKLNGKVFRYAVEE